MPADAERLGRIEEQVNGLRDDVADIKTGIRDQNHELKEMVSMFLGEIHKVRNDTHTKEEIALMMSARDKIEEERNRKVEKLEKKVDSLSAWRYWLMGGLALLGVILTLLAEAHIWK